MQSLPSTWARKASSLERLICRSAEKVITTTSELSQHFKSEYPDLKEKFETITNGFDKNPCDFECQGAASRSKISDAKSTSRPLKICHFGTVYGARNPFPLLYAVKELVAQENVTSNQIRITFFGRWDVPNEDKQTLQELEERNLISRIPQIPHGECLDEMARTDFLLILQPDSPLQIPGKIYEYLSLKIPILVIGDKGATASLVKRYQLGFCCPNDVHALKEILFKIVTQHEPIPPPSKSVVPEFHYQSLTKQLANVLNSVC